MQISLCIPQCDRKNWNARVKKCTVYARTARVELRRIKATYPEVSLASLNRNEWCENVFHNIRIPMFYYGLVTEGIFSENFSSIILSCRKWFFFSSNSWVNWTIKMFLYKSGNKNNDSIARFEITLTIPYFLVKRKSKKKRKENLFVSTTKAKVPKKTRINAMFECEQCKFSSLRSS